VRGWYKQNLTVAAVILGRLGFDPDRVWVVHVVPGEREKNAIKTFKNTSGGKSYPSWSCSCCKALLATVRKAFSTLVLSLAETSKYGMLPFDWHQSIAFFCEF
jgi:hypothetical protein